MKSAAQPIVRIQIVFRQFVIVYKTEHVKQLLHTHMKHYTKVCVRSERRSSGRELCRLRIDACVLGLAWQDVAVSYNPFLPILGTGLVTSEGSLWKRQRQLVMHAFRVDILDEIVGEIGAAMGSISVWALRYGRAEHDGWGLCRWLPSAEAREHRRLNRVLNDYVLDIIQTRWVRWDRSIRMIGRWMSDACGGDIGVQEELKQRGSGKLAKEDILEKVLQATAEGGKKWDKDTKQQLAYEFKTFVLAGHETSAAMLTWALFELIHVRRGLSVW